MGIHNGRCFNGSLGQVSKVVIRNSFQACFPHPFPHPFPSLSTSQSGLSNPVKGFGGALLGPIVGQNDSAVGLDSIYTTSRSAIAERPRCWVRYSFGQKWKTGTGRQYFRSIFYHCDIIGLQSYRIR